MKKLRKPLQKILLSFALAAALVIGGVPLDGHVLVSMAIAAEGTSSQNAIEIDTWEELRNALSDDGTKRAGESETTPTYFKLIANCTDSVRTSDSYIEVGQGRSVVLDLNSGTLDRGLSNQGPMQNGHVIMVAEGASLTVDDNSAGKQGKIAGGNTNDDGGGVYIEPGAKFTLNNGSISGNKAELAGGGVFCVGNFTMNGGTISGNKADEGAGVYVCDTSKALLCGGKITGNNAKGSGGGVGRDAYGFIGVSGSPIIIGNAVGTSEYNVHLFTFFPYIAVIGKLTEEAIIGFYYDMEGKDVVKASQDYNGGKLSADDLSHFISDDPDYTVTLTENGTGQLVKKAPSSFKKEPVGKNGLIANGKSQELVTAGEAEGGTVYYAVTENNSEPNESAFSASVPKKTDAGTYYVWYMIKGDSSHTNVAAKSITVKITPATVGVSGITLNKTSATIETGKTLQLSHTITPANATNKGVTYSSSNTSVATVSNSGLVTGVKAGTADITATAGGKSAVCKVTVKKTDIVSATVSGISDKPYTGQAITQSPTVTLDDKTLQSGTDYTLSYANNINAGTATLTITGTGSYTGSLQKTFDIAKAKQTITASDITKTTADAAFSIGAKASGAGKLSYKSGNTKVVTVDENGKATIKGAGSTTITITAAATANYNKATKTVNVTVTSKSSTKKSIAKATITGLKTKAYTGKAITQSPTVKLGSTKLKAGTDYTASYKNNKNVGTATITITGKGSYKGTATATFKIKKADNSLKVKAKKTTYSITYSKLAKKDQVIKETQIYNVTKKGQGKLSYVLVSANTGKKSVKKSFSVDKKTGKLTAKKGLKKGTYNVELSVTAAGDKNHNKATKKFIIPIKVK